MTPTCQHFMRTSTTGNATVFHLHGGIDSIAVEEIRAAITPLLAPGSPVVVLDLAEVTFIGSGGIGMLICFQKTARENGVQLSLAAGPSCVRQVIDLLHFQRVLPLHATVQSALATTTAAHP